MLEYSQPLMELMEKKICSEERVVLVGHSLGGMSIAYAMENFPEKVSVSVFLSAFMPDTVHHPGYVFDKFLEFVPREGFMDTQFSVEEGGEKTKTTMLFGRDFISSKLMQLSPAEDLALVTMLTRVGSMFVDDLSTAVSFTEEGYGSVNRVYIVCKGDKVVTADYPQWTMENSPVKQVKEIEGADHFAMLSKPQEVCDVLLELADKYP